MSVELGNATQSWDVLTGHLQAFIDAWEASHEPPNLAHHLPPAGDEMRRIVLVELIKVDLEYRAQNKAEQTVRNLEAYANEFQELQTDGKIPSDLIYEEYHVRKTAGEDVRPDEFFKRFPDNANELRRLFPIDTSTFSTSMFRPESRQDAIEPGDVLDEFELILRLGKGAFASVFLARQKSMQRLVALKVSADQGTEPQTLAQLDHPNIVRVYDQRGLPDRKLRLLYMQYVAGGTLQTVVNHASEIPIDDRSGKIIVDAIKEEAERSGQVVAGSEMLRRLTTMKWQSIVCRLGAQIASALEYAHSKGVLHRDIKPANVLLAADGSPKLADFNISFSSKLEGATPAAYFGGSLAYMSPEQLEACNPAHERKPDDLDGRCDIYSLGVMLWELLYGQRPFKDPGISESWTTTLGQMSEQRRAGVTENDQEPHIEDSTRQLCLVLQKCLAPNRDDRYLTADELARDLLICTQPHAQQLLHLPTTGWRNFARNWPITAILLAVLPPNILAAFFNYYYNRAAIVEHLSVFLPTFWKVQLVINLVAFPIGIILAAVITWPIVKGILYASDEKLSKSPVAARVRQRALAFGHIAAIIGIAEWMVAGVTYPISLQVLGGALSTGDYIHFATSLAICGLIAAAYPFFFSSVLAVRVFFPTLLKREKLNESDETALERLGWRSGIYLLVAGGVPVVGVILLVVSNLFTQSQSTVALLVMSVVGGLGLLLAFALYRTIQRDVATFLNSASPIDSLSLTVRES